MTPPTKNAAECVNAKSKIGHFRFRGSVIAVGVVLCRTNEGCGGTSTAATVTLSYISKLEAGGASPGLDTMERLANALRVEIAELVPAPAPQPADQAAVKKRFETVMAKAGTATLSMLDLLLERLADSAALGS